MQSFLGQAYDGKEADRAFVFALGRPIERGALRVPVDKKHFVALGKGGGQVDAERRFADAAFLV
jgi:hypothetical protein